MTAAVPALSRRPTARGAVLLLCGLGLFLLGTHLSSNAVFLLAFFCLSLPLAAPLPVWSVPKRIVVQPVGFEPVAAGSSAVLSFRLASPRLGAARVVLETGVGVATPSEDGGSGRGRGWAAHLPPLRRGIHTPGEISLVAFDPLGLFRVARPLSEDEARAVPPLVIYPQPDWDQPAAPTGDSSAAMRLAQEGEIAGVRPYRISDGRRAVDWRASARAEDLVVREYERSAKRDALVFDWADLAGQQGEAKLSRLTAGVLEAARDGLAVGLRLPGYDLPARRGPAHLDEILTALAGFGTRGDRSDQ